MVIDNYIGITNWYFNGSKLAEVLTLLQLIHYLYTIIIRMILGSIMVLLDRKFVINEVNGDLVKTT